LDLIGQSLGRYHILEQLGEGGMATVFRAYDTRLERDVAIKVIRVDQFAPSLLERILKRFEREAKSLARLSHPNIVAIIDFGEYQNIPYLVMVYLPGGTLKDRMGKAMPWGEAARLLVPIARALDYAHREGVIHRDVKPTNILMARSGDPMLTDFGIAKLLDPGEAQTLTGTGLGIGTPEYMAPEQGLGQEIDARADIYALGVVFYELVTGRKPYTADTPMAVVFKHMTDPLPRPGVYVPGLPETVEKVLIKALAKKPDDPYENMEKFAAALESLTGTQPGTPAIIPGRARLDDNPLTRQQPFDTQATIDEVGAAAPRQSRVTTNEAVRVVTNQTSQKTIAQDLTVDIKSEKPKVEPTQQKTEPPVNLTPHWKTVFLIALGWSLGALLGKGVFSSLGYPFSTFLTLCIGGLFTALVLRWETAISSWKELLIIILSWVILHIPELGGYWWHPLKEILDPLVGGLTIAVCLYRNENHFSWKDVVWVVAGWLPMGIFLVIPLFWNLGLDYSVGMAIRPAVGGAIGGAIMIWRLRKKDRALDLSTKT